MFIHNPTFVKDFTAPTSCSCTRDDFQKSQNHSAKQMYKFPWRWKILYVVQMLNYCDRLRDSRPEGRTRILDCSSIPGSIPLRTRLLPCCRTAKERSWREIIKSRVRSGLAVCLHELSLAFDVVSAGGYILTCFSTVSAEARSVSSASSLNFLKPVSRLHKRMDHGVSERCFRG